MKKSNTLFLLFFTYLSQQVVLAQSAAPTEKEVTNRNQVWVGYFNQTRINNKFLVWLDLHARRTDFMDCWATTIIQPGITYHLSEQVRFTAGYAYASH